MNVVYIGKGYPEIIDMLARSRHRVVGILHVKSSRRLAPARLRILECGQALNGFLRSSASLRRKAMSMHIPYCPARGVKGPGVESWLLDRHADIFVVYDAPLLPRRIFAIPALGSVNMHPALLPKYRGGCPSLWISRAGDLQAGLTVHFIDDGMDTGDILAQGSFPFPPGGRWEEEKGRILGLMERLLPPTLDAIEAGTATRTPQPPASPTPPANTVSLTQYGAMLADASVPPDRMWHFLRGTEPHLNRWLKMARPWGRAGSLWRVEDFSACADGMPAGTLERRGSSCCLHVPGGLIRLGHQWRFRTWVKDILRMGSLRAKR